MFVEPINSAIGGWSFVAPPTAATEVGTFRPNSVILAHENSSPVENRASSHAGKNAQETVVFGHNTADIQALSSIYGGEIVYSLRTCMKRYQLTDVYRVPDGTAGLTIPSFPISRGTVVGGLGNVTANQTEHAGSMSLISLISRCFAGYRGSIRHNFLISDMQRLNQTSEDPILVVSRITQDLFDIDLPDVPHINMNDNPDIVPLIDTIPLGWAGMEFIAASVNPSAKIEVPFYSGQMFRPTKFAVVDDARLAIMWLDHDRDGRAGRSSREIVHCVSAGEDLSFGIFTYVPPVTIYKLPGQA
jgi:hypothetical protein